MGRQSEATAYSAVVITKDRPAHVREAVRRLLRQTTLPRRIVVVDASDPPISLGSALHRQAETRGVDLTHVRTRPCVSRQRNEGVRHVATPITLHVDDDVAIPDDYMERLLERWSAHGLERVGGAVGAIRDEGRPSLGARAANLGRLLLQLHVVRRSGTTRLRRSGKVSFVPVPADDVLIDVSWGGAVAFRTDLLRRHRFDETFVGRIPAEDMDLTVRLARERPLLNTPATWYMHQHAPSGRTSSEEFWYRRSRQEAYFRLRHIGRDPLTLAAFAVSIAGELAGVAGIAARVRHPGPLRAYLRGLAETVDEARGRGRGRLPTPPPSVEAAVARLRRAEQRTPVGRP